VSLPFIDCPEVFGKTIKSLRLYPESVEAIIEFADGTSLSWCTVRKSNTKATLFRSGIGAPEVLNEYDI
jgi:hypothetical protein